MHKIVIHVFKSLLERPRHRVEEELSQARIASTQLEKKLQSDLIQMRRTLSDKEKTLEESQRTLEEERKAKTRVNEELRQARIASTELEERLQNEQRTSQSRLQELHSKEN